MTTPEFNWIYSEFIEDKRISSCIWFCRWQLLGEPGDSDSTYVVLNVERNVDQDYWKVHASLNIDEGFDLDECDRYVSLLDDEDMYKTVEEAKASAEKWFVSWLDKSFSASIKDVE